GRGWRWFWFRVARVEPGSVRICLFRRWNVRSVSSAGCFQRAWKYRAQSRLYRIVPMAAAVIVVKRMSSSPLSLEVPLEFPANHVRKLLDARLPRVPLCTRVSRLSVSPHLFRRLESHCNVPDQGSDVSVWRRHSDVAQHLAQHREVISETCEPCRHGLEQGRRLRIVKRWKHEDLGAREKPPNAERAHGAYVADPVVGLTESLDCAPVRSVPRNDELDIDLWVSYELLQHLEDSFAKVQASHIQGSSLKRSLTFSKEVEVVAAHAVEDDGDAITGEPMEDS